MKQFGGMVGETIVSNRHHPIYVRGKGWTPVAELVIGDEIVSAIWQHDEGPKPRIFTVSEDEIDVAVTLSVVERLVIHKGALTAYNLEVADFHTFFVGRSALWVHNVDGKGDNGGNGSTDSGEADTSGDKDVSDNSDDKSKSRSRGRGKNKGKGKSKTGKTTNIKVSILDTRAPG